MKRKLVMAGLVAVMLPLAGQATILFQDTFDRPDTDFTLVGVGTDAVLVSLDPLDSSTVGITGTKAQGLGVNTYFESINGCDGPFILTNKFGKRTGTMGAVGLNHNFVAGDLQTVVGGTYDGKLHMSVSLDALKITGNGGTAAAVDVYDRFMGFGIGYAYGSISNMPDINGTATPLAGLRPGHLTNGVQNVTGAPGALFFEYAPLLDPLDNNGKTNAQVVVYKDNLVLRYDVAGSADLGTLKVDLFFDQNFAAGSNVSYYVHDNASVVAYGTYTLVNDDNYMAFGARSGDTYGYEGDNLVIESLTTVIPEPATIGMIAISALGILIGRRMKML